MTQRDKSESLLRRALRDPYLRGLLTGFVGSNLGWLLVRLIYG